MTLAELTKARADLLKARASGVQQYRDQNGEIVTYKSDAEMRAALASLDAEIAAMTRKPRSTLYLKTSKGL